MAGTEVFKVHDRRTILGHLLLSIIDLNVLKIISQKPYLKHLSRSKEDKFATAFILDKRPQKDPELFK